MDSMGKLWQWLKFLLETYSLQTRRWRNAAVFFFFFLSLLLLLLLLLVAFFSFLVLDASAFPPWVGSADILLRRSHLAFTEMAFQYFSILFNTFHFFLGSDKVSSRRPFQFLEVRGWQAWVESDRRGNRVAWRFVLYMWYHMFKVRICPKLWEAFEDSQQSQLDSFRIHRFAHVLSNEGATPTRQWVF